MSTGLDDRVSGSGSARDSYRHPLWVRLCHGFVAVSFSVLAITGFLILMVHPRLYWGEAGNDLMPALLELPISGNHRPEGWRRTVEFSPGVFSADRTHPTFNENGWSRSTHFLAAWVLVVAGALYVIGAVVTRHWRRVVPTTRELALSALWSDVKRHAQPSLLAREARSTYGPLQKSAYASVIFVLLPFMLVTGLTMSPAVTAAYPRLLDLFGGHQSARTLHFAGFAALLTFLLVHLSMVALTGCRRQLRSMTVGS